MAQYINKSACKKALLNLAQQRAHKFTRVGSDVFDHLDIVLINAMRALVHSHPSIGKTISLGTRKRTSDDKDDPVQC